MKRITLIMCVLLSVLMACGQKQRKTVAKSTTVSSFTVKSLECNDSSSYADVSLRVDWPQGNSSLARKVRSYLKSQLDSVLSINLNVQPDQNLKLPSYKGSLSDGHAMLDFYSRLLCDSLTASSKSIRQDFPSSPSYAANAKLRLDGKSSRFVTYVTEVYSFRGGAHGMTTVYGVSIDRRTGKVIRALRPTQTARRLQPLLRKGVLEYFAANGQPVKDAELNDMLLLDGNAIPLPVKAPYLTPTGVHFVYQQYEIAPYAAGHIEFTIPYAKLK